MTDGELIRAAKTLERLNEQMLLLMDKMEGHPNAGPLLKDLQDNGLGYSWDFLEIVRPHLVRPDYWRVQLDDRLTLKAAKEKP